MSKFQSPPTRTGTPQFLERSIVMKANSSSLVLIRSLQPFYDKSHGDEVIYDIIPTILPLILLKGCKNPECTRVRQ